MHIPNYKDGSIVNLMSSIGTALKKRMLYRELKALPAKELKGKRIALVIIDGMGYEFLKKQKDSFLSKNIKSFMTSVFPSTTASAITTFRTGVAPQQHATTGWFMNLKEIGTVGRILPFSPRYGGDNFSKHNIDISQLLNVEPFTKGMKKNNLIVTHSAIAKSDYSELTNNYSLLHSYNTMKGFFMQLKKGICNKEKKLIYAYYPFFDEMSHEFGIYSNEALMHFNMLDKGLKKIVDSAPKDTTIIITADHGQIEIEKNKVVFINDHPDLYDCLSLPLCGEPRAAYCYIKTARKKKFEDYVKKKLNNKCHLFKSEELIKNNFFGLYKPNPKLYDRIGDYCLVMKENYIIRDLILGEKKGFKKGNHGGVSREEMHVPLIVFK